MTQSIVRELVYYGKHKKFDFFKVHPISSIYFGGGTPSILPIEDIAKILETIYENYSVAENPEITLEANPDDLTPDYCQQLNTKGINRLSIGIQSFFEEHLKWMNRSHNALQAETCVNNAVDAGIKNISIDLIYGFPGLSNDQWLANLQIAQNFPINHLSCYCLTVEERTPLKKLIETKRYLPTDEHLAAKHFNMLSNWTAANHWEHYEISNLCRNGFYSKHNTAYWQQEPYLGIGPSAHSYNGLERRWNVKDNNAYIENWQIDKPLFEIELLTPTNKLNEYILTALRTCWGLNLDHANELANINFMETKMDLIKKYSALNLLTLDKNCIKLTNEGRLFADGIAADFFVN